MPHRHSAAVGRSHSEGGPLDQFRKLLANKEDFYRDLIEHSQDLLCVHTLDGRLLSMNEHPARLLGYTPEEVLQLPMVELLAPEFRHEFPKYLAKIRESGTASGRMVLLTRSGQRRVWEYHNSLRTEGVSEPLVRGVAHDITERINVEGELCKRLQEVSFLREIGQTMSGGKRLEDVLRTAVDGARNATNADLVLLFMREDTTLRLRVASGRHEREFSDQNLPVHVLGECLCGIALQEAKPVYSPEVATDPRCTRPECKNTGLYSFAALPLIDEHHAVFGVLGIGSLARRDFTKDNIFLEALATEISFAIKNALLLEEAKNRALLLQREVLERMAAQRSQQESETLFKTFVKAAPLGIHMYRLEENGRLIFIGANPAADRILGVRHAELIGKDIEAAFPTLIGTDIPDRYRRIAACGGRWDAEHVDYEDNRIKGSYEVNAFQISPGSVGAMFVDVTERARTAEIIQHSESRLRSFVESAPYGICRASIARNRFLTSNPALTRMLGYTSQEEVLALKLSEIQVDVDCGRRFLANIRKRQDFHGIELSLKAKDGKPIMVRVSGRVVHDVEGYDVIECIVEDVTQHRLLEEQFFQAQKMEAVGRLAGGVAHDFNNLLSIILGYSEMLEEELAGRRCLDKLQEIKLAAQRAAALTAQLLAFSRKQVLSPRAIDVNAVVLETHKMLRRLIGEDVRLELRLERELWITKADPSQLVQVVMNLSVNARDAMPRGGQLVVSTSNVRIDHELPCQGGRIPLGDFVLISVSDNGVGMDTEVQARIFDPFFTTKPEGKGTGLGLTTIYGIVRQAGGYISVSSEINRGTTFNVYLPRTNAKPSIDQGQEITDVLAGKETILLAEDTASLREFLCEALQPFGYQVLAAKDGAEALTIAAEHEGAIDVLITDLIMPSMSGADLASRLRLDRPTVKTLYMSGYTDDRLTGNPILDARTYIQKPFAITELLQKVRGLIGSNGLC